MEDLNVVMIGATPDDVPILCESQPTCWLCGRSGQITYTTLNDTVFGVPGTWQMRGCQSCGLLWLDPRPVQTELPRLYHVYYTHTTPGPGNQRLASICQAIWRQIWSDLLGYPPAQLPIMYRIAIRMLQLIPAVSDSAILEVMGVHATWGTHLLDVGCGNGRYLAQMRALGWAVTGVEVDPIAAAQARTHFGLTVHTGTLNDVGFPPNSFDVVTISHVIEHVDDPLGLLRESLRVLRPGGRVVITTPNSVSLGHRWFGAAWRGLEPPRHLMIFSPHALDRLVRQTGFQRVKLQTSGRLARSIYAASRINQARVRGIAPPDDKKIRVKLQRYLFQSVEEFGRLLLNDIGEEIFYIGVKPL